MDTNSRELLTFLLNSLWQIPAVAGVAAVACRVMRNSPAAHRHAVWVAALVAALFLPLASVRFTAPLTPASAFTAAPAAPDIATAASAHGTRSTALPAKEGNSTGGRRLGITIAYAPAAGGLLIAAYFLFLLIQFARLARAWRRTVQLRRRSTRIDAPPPVIRQVWQRCQTALDMSSRHIELRSSRELTSPVAAGQHAIILPEALLASTDHDLLTTAIGHEMAHLARHDFPCKLLYEILYLPITFQPAAWLIRRGLEETRELACDELVTHKLLDAGVYARSLVSIAASITSFGQPGYYLGVFDGNILERRVRRLLQPPAMTIQRARLLLAGGLSAVALCAVAASGIALTARAQTSDLDAQVKAVEPLILAFSANPSDQQLLAKTRQALTDILAHNAASQPALDGMMTVALMAKQPAEARQWALKLVAFYPREKTAYYSVGVADWELAYGVIRDARTAAGLQPQDNDILPNAATRHALRDRYLPQISEGKQMLDTAIKLDPQFADAMAYMNLLYRLNAYLAETPAEADEQTKKADEWVKKALAAKRLSPPTPSGNRLLTAPPPPPPPPPPSRSSH